jgi:hypothetical protein
LRDLHVHTINEGAARGILSLHDALGLRSVAYEKASSEARAILSRGIGRFTSHFGPDGHWRARAR